MGFNVKDAALKVTRALPNGAANVVSDSIDLGHGARGDFLDNMELLITAPAVTTAMLGDAATLIYDVLHSDSANLSSGASVLITAVITQTGAGGAGALGTTAQVRLPVDVKRYVGVRATKSATGNASTVNLTIEPVF